MSGVVRFLLVKNDSATARYSETRVLGGTGPQKRPDSGELIRSAGSDDCTCDYSARGRNGWIIVIKFNIGW